MNTLKYKDYLGTVNFSEKDGVFFGKIDFSTTVGHFFPNPKLQTSKIGRANLG